MNYDHFIQIIKFESVYTLPLLKYWLFTMLSFELVGYNFYQTVPIKKYIDFLNENCLRLSCSDYQCLRDS